MKGDEVAMDRTKLETVDQWHRHQLRGSLSLFTAPAALELD